jgi:senataxin
LVGDPKQLPPTVLSREAAGFQYEQSLFVRMQLNHPDDVHLLDTQYRMHPDISRFPSQAFYDGRLLDGQGLAQLRTKLWHESSLLGPYRFFDVQGSHRKGASGYSLINREEVAVALQLYNRLTTDYAPYDFSEKIGIITPYKSQLKELKTQFERHFGETIFDRVEFNTTDAFQGRESEIIIFSCVRASPHGGIGFLDDIRRMNVGLTRAKSSLWVLGNSPSLLRNEFWGNLVRDAQRRDCYTDGDLIGLLKKPLVRRAIDREVEMSLDGDDVKPSAAAVGPSRDHETKRAIKDAALPTKVKREDPVGAQATTKPKKAAPLPNPPPMKPKQPSTGPPPIPHHTHPVNGEAKRKRQESQSPPMGPRGTNPVVPPPSRPATTQPAPIVRPSIPKLNKNNVAPPTVKKAADPFIRPKNKKPRPR